MRFEGASFHGTAHFIDAEIRPWAGFDDVTFHGLAHFQRAKFEPTVGDRRFRESSACFKRSQFRTRADFEDAEFVLNANFRETEFQGTVDFETAKFRNQADFTKARFNDRTSFRNTGFGRVPRFAETDLNEATDFSGIDWQQTERPYTLSVRTWWHRDRRKMIKEEANAAIQTWDKLALVMSQREKFPRGTNSTGSGCARSAHWMDMVRYRSRTCCSMCCQTMAGDLAAHYSGGPFNSLQARYPWPPPRHYSVLGSNLVIGRYSGNVGLSVSLILLHSYGLVPKMVI